MDDVDEERPSSLILWRGRPVLNEIPNSQASTGDDGDWLTRVLTSCSDCWRVNRSCIRSISSCRRPVISLLRIWSLASSDDELPLGLREREDVGGGGGGGSRGGVRGNGRGLLTESFGWLNKKGVRDLGTGGNPLIEDIFYSLNFHSCRHWKRQKQNNNIHMKWLCFVYTKTYHRTVLIYLLRV